MPVNWHDAVRRATKGLPNEIGVLRTPPSFLTAARLGSVPFLMYLVGGGLYFYGLALYLSVLLTDVLDGHLARKLGMSSRFGSYFDATTDFVVVFGMFLAFEPAGFVPFWVLVVIVLFFAQYIITSLLWGRIRDPLGKHYGTLLYGAVGLRFLVSGPAFDEVVSVAIAVFSAAAFIGRMMYLQRVSSEVSSGQTE